jgi:hypothetical protein
MKKPLLHRALSVVAIATFIAAPVSAQRNPDLAPYMIGDRLAEMSLARTAAPRRISDSATVLVLTSKGYVEAAHGTNGFTCLVARSFMGSIGDPDFWNAKIRAPHCFNPPAVRTVMPQILKRAEWITRGVTPTDIATRTNRAYQTHELPLPAAGAMAYMLSPKQVLGNTDPHWMPHLMFYYDRSMPAAAWGAAGFKDPIIDATAGDAKSPVQTLLIPVRQWSDGSAAH